MGVLTGLAREVSSLPPQSENLIIKCAGASPDRAEYLSRELVSSGCTALLSFGVAGALSPELKVGDIVVATGVIDASGNEIPASENWRHHLIAGLPIKRGAVWQGRIYGADKA
ncbi:MAG: hypothetical protein HQ473_07725, partial [Cryomorphaceae bacterium]|nr:hypothetical protein [Cryomorphaceae bacterium]